MSDWTPDRPLEAGASDEQIAAREVYKHERASKGGMVPPQGDPTVEMVREFAAACGEDERRIWLLKLTKLADENVRLRSQARSTSGWGAGVGGASSDVSGDVTATLTAECTRLSAETAALTAELAALRRDAERWKFVRLWFEIAEDEGSDFRLFVTVPIGELNEECVSDDGDVLPQEMWPTIERVIDVHMADAAARSLPAPAGGTP